MSNVLYAFFITSFIEKTYFPLKRKKKTNLCPLFFSLFHNDYDIVMVNVIIVTQQSTLCHHPSATRMVMADFALWNRKEV